MSVLKTILCALSFVTTVFASEKYGIFEPNRNLMRYLPVVESPDPCGIDRLISSKDTPFVGEAIPVSPSSMQAVNLADDFSEEEGGSFDGTQASNNNDQTLKSEIEQTEDDVELGDNLEIESLKSVDIVLDDKDVQEIPPASAGCCVIQ
jgi:hypothetical protein